MSDQGDVHVKLDDRIRLMSALLAATNYPDQVQKLKPHGTHPHARTTRKHLMPYADHPAVQATQSLLDQGVPLEALYALVYLMRWPDLTIKQMPNWVPTNYGASLKDFYDSAGLAELWEKESTMWDKAVTQARNVFASMQFKQFFKPFVGDVNETLVFMPNISHPTDYEVGFKVGGELVAIAPPPLAWGDSPPWPYDEPTMISHAYRAVITLYGRELLKTYLRQHLDKLEAIAQHELPVSDQFKAKHPTWEDQFTVLFLSAVVALYLEDYVDEKEYRSFVLMERKTRGMSILPGVVSVLRRYLQEKDTSDKYNNLIEFLPIFPRQLRVAQKIVSL